MDADVADLERALEAVKARSTRALANEELYQARIKELERMNRALVLQVASLGKGEAAGTVALAGAAADVAAGEASSVEGSPRRDLRRVCSYKTLRTKSNHLSVERIDLTRTRVRIGPRAPAPRRVHYRLCPREVRDHRLRLRARLRRGAQPLRLYRREPLSRRQRGFPPQRWRWHHPRRPRRRRQIPVPARPVQRRRVRGSRAPRPRHPNPPTQRAPLAVLLD